MSILLHIHHWLNSGPRWFYTILTSVIFYYLGYRDALKIPDWNKKGWKHQ